MRQLKLNKIGLLAIAALLSVMLFVGPALALDPIFCKSMIGTTAGGTLGSDTRAYGAFVIIPGDNNSQVVVASVSGTADGTGAVNNIWVYDKENEATISSSDSAGVTSLVISSGGTSFDASDIIVIQAPSGSPVFAESVSSTGATTIALNGTTDYAVYSGYKVYEMEEIARIPVGNGTASYQSDVAVAAGQKDSPLFLYIGGTSACSINFASGHYR